MRNWLIKTKGWNEEVAMKQTSKIIKMKLQQGRKITKAIAKYTNTTRGRQDDTTLQEKGTEYAELGSTEDNKSNRRRAKQK